MTRRRWTPRRRLALFEAHGGRCHICGQKIDGVKERYEIEHIIPLALGGADDESNCAPAHVLCHKAKTATDKAQIAKANRVRAKHNGAREIRNPIPGSRGGKWKRKLDGTVVRRDE